MDYFLAVSLNMVGNDKGIKILMENKIFFMPHSMSKNN